MLNLCLLFPFQTSCQSWPLCLKMERTISWFSHFLVTHYYKLLIMFTKFYLKKKGLNWLCFRSFANIIISGMEDNLVKKITFPRFEGPKFLYLSHYLKCVLTCTDALTLWGLTSCQGSDTWCCCLATVGQGPLKGTWLSLWVSDVPLQGMDSALKKKGRVAVARRLPTLWWGF